MCDTLGRPAGPYLWLIQIEKAFTKHHVKTPLRMMSDLTQPEFDLTQPPGTLATPERAALYNSLVEKHFSGTRKFKSVAKFHAAYLELGGTPRRKSVGKDRLNAGRKVGRKMNRLSHAQQHARAAAEAHGRAHPFIERNNLYPSESKTNRHGKQGQDSLAAYQLRLPRGASWCGTGRQRLGPPGRSRGGRHYVKIGDRAAAQPEPAVNPI